MRLREEAGSTVIVYEVEAQIAGRMAQLGGPIIDATAKQLAGKFFSRFGEIVGGAQNQRVRPAKAAPSAVLRSGGAPRRTLPLARLRAAYPWPGYSPP